MIIFKNFSASVKTESSETIFYISNMPQETVMPKDLQVPVQPSRKLQGSRCCPTCHDGRLSVPSTGQPASEPTPPEGQENGCRDFSGFVAGGAWCRDHFGTLRWMCKYGTTPQEAVSRTVRNYGGGRRVMIPQANPNKSPPVLTNPDNMLFQK